LIVRRESRAFSPHVSPFLFSQASSPVSGGPYQPGKKGTISLARDPHDRVLSCAVCHRDSPGRVVASDVFAVAHFFEIYIEVTRHK
jgi:hypothetical protein